jgi:hypothetical protein
VRDPGSIARTVHILPICKYFVRSALSRGIDRQWTATDRHGKYRLLSYSSRRPKNHRRRMTLLCSTNTVIRRKVARS